MSKRFVFLALLCGCAGAPSEPIEPAEPEQPAAITPPPANRQVAKAAPDPAVAKLHEELVASIARDYEYMQLADDEFHWAPYLCRMPSPGGQHISEADGGAHEGKLFVLYAADLNRYGRAVGWIEPDWPDPPLRKLFVLPPGEVRPPRSGPPLLQALVKESFVPREFHPGDDPGPHADLHAASKNGKTMVPGDPIGLFMMLELEGKPAGTDEGWIYATVAPDGTVTSSDVGACHDCHRTRENRLFGLGTRPG